MSISALYTPLKWQVDPFRSKAKVMLLTGAAGGGKSRVAAEKIHAFMIKYPGATGIMGRKDRTTANKSVVPFMRYTVQKDSPWGEYKKSDGLFQYYNGSQLWVIGLRDENQREGLRSIGKDGSVDIAWMEEANKLSEDDDNEIAARMRGNSAGWRQRIYTTNPDAPDHWIKRQLMEGGKATVFYSRPEDNPYNPPDYIETLQALTGVLRQRLWEGLWVQAEGAVYSEYSVQHHLIDYKDIPGLEYGLLPQFGRYFVSVDFGYTNPFTASLWYLDQNDDIYLVRQIYKTKKIVEDHAPDIRKMVGELPIEAWICDHDAEDRATLEKHLQIKTKGAYKAVMPGIEAVKSRLQDNRIRFVRGALFDLDLKLELAKRPTCLIDEISGYRWSDRKQDTPIKENDHGCDDMRYLVAHVDNIGKKIIKVRTKATLDNYVRGIAKEDEEIKIVYG